MKRLSAVGALFVSACLRPAEDRVALDREVGRAAYEGASVEVAEGLAAVRAFGPAELTLWAQAPALDITLRGASGALRLDVLNAMPEAELRVDDGEPISGEPLPDHAAGLRFELVLSSEASVLRLAPSDFAAREPFVFAVLSDVQTAIDDVDEVFARINEDPEIRYVLSTGDLVDQGTRPELERFQRELRALRVPYFTTVGNHEMGAPASSFHTLFGRFNTHFAFRGVQHSLVDSANATIDPAVYDALAGWLDDAQEATHVVCTHVPPLDPAGLRGGGFRNRNEAAKFVAMLGRGAVDALFLGHIHSYYAFSSAGVPTYISGGGGATPERFDGIERHYLRVTASRDGGIHDVALVRVD